MKEHTPGPWLIENLHSRGDGDMACYEIAGPDGESIVECDGGYYPPHNGDMFLIAAAPDLLMACKEALNAFEHNSAIDWDDLARAIAKAERKPTKKEQKENGDDIRHPGPQPV